ncbi:polyketide cyclase [Erythrobacter sp. HI0019]|uniref:cyclase family protein n=1 Tax=unclassified Erythrobacter TaxID=2633097 RepID=UPI0007B8AB52|nr:MULTISPECIES: cyclase family protein [unclassified Erythrobacter]KZX94737.1 polyketide cyclase [Erythrobacter sp. HI0019]KZY10376.1 polyketide cyclase [Erythrobacter sp. HI0028]
MNTLSTTLVALSSAAVLTVSSASVLAQEVPPSSYGPDDEIGAVNLLDEEKVLEATRLVRQGKVYPLGMIVNEDTPAFRHRYFHVETLQPETGTAGSNKFTYVDDQLIGWTGVGSQINGLAHYGRDNVHYNGHKVEDFLTVRGVTKLGLEKLPPMVTRGVLLDMRPYYGQDIVEEGTVFSPSDIDAVAQEQGVEIREGDVVLFCTGWMDLMGKDNERYLAGGSGIGTESARFLAEKGVVGVGADNWSFEAVPHQNDEVSFPVNQMMATEYGVQVFENLRCDHLAQDEAWEFMFVLGHPLYEGSTQVQINPAAIR